MWESKLPSTEENFGDVFCPSTHEIDACGRLGFGGPGSMNRLSPLLVALRMGFI